MTSITDIGTALEARQADLSVSDEAARLLRLGEGIVEHWVKAREFEPTRDKREGFRLIALHRQGAKGEPSFNACRETCRELAYYYNLVSGDTEHAETDKRLELMRLVAMHLYLFISGKMQFHQLGEFCCASKPLRLNEQTSQQEEMSDA